jgi:prepilin-type processing-associated H-X9-DG protein
VVIAIIAILAAILFPVFARAREKARMASCQSNLKELQLGIVMYTQDHDERTPGAYGNSTQSTSARPGADNPAGPVYGWGGAGSWWMWCDMIYPYVRNLQIYHCPSGSSSRCDYNMNNWASPGSHVSSGKKLALIPKPAEQIALYDSWGLRSCGRAHGYRLDSNGSLPWCYGYPTCDETKFVPGNQYAQNRERHNAGCNYSFMDGHVKWLNNSETYMEGTSSSNPSYQKYWNPT